MGRNDGRLKGCQRAAASCLNGTPPSSVVVNTQGRESRCSGFETCSGVWYPRRRPCGVAINTLVDLINWLGIPQVSCRMVRVSGV